MEWTLELVLVVLLLATLIQALRLERALGVLKRDRAALEALIAGFNASTRQAEAGVERLKTAADGAGRRLEQQIGISETLRDDLRLFSERGDQVADRLDALVRAARLLHVDPDPRHAGTSPRTPPPQGGRTEAEQNLLQALRLAR
ncbi:MAG: hypothetical protein JSS43_04025 [Proteobacteria bacterium]|nr:hypothetical protein [Pseudomonadota bacterium]